MKTVMTPPEQFSNLDAYPFKENYRDVTDADGNTVKMHYIDEGTGPVTVLLLHGQPSWSYLYRKMVPLLVKEGLRVIAPDLIGFGKSEKPVEQSDYTYTRHVAWLTDFIRQEGGDRLIMFCQDWGGLTGLRIAGFHPELFAAVVAANTGLPVGGQKMDDSWYTFKKFCREAKKLPFGRLIQSGCVSKLTSEEKAAYAAPFPEEVYCAGPRIFPSLIPLEADEPEAVTNQQAFAGLRKFEKPFITAFSDSDPITARGDLFLKRFIPGAKSRDDHTTIKEGGHFLQEDQPEACVAAIMSAVKAIG